MKNMNDNKKIMVTGGLGFIGSHFIEMLLKEGYHIINVDKRTYASREGLEFEKDKNHKLIEKDICDLKTLPEGISHIINFAAESHVDNSIANSSPFIQSNVVGVFNLLELVRKTQKEKRPIFIQISTDEVYGDILDGSFKETDRLIPSSPYSASKAAADQLVMGWSRTYGLRTRICRSSNNYGFGQTDTKLVPTTMKNAFKKKKAIVHGDGSYKREWLYVEDNCEAIRVVMKKGKDNEIYNISSGNERTNLEVVKLILRAMNLPENHYEHVADRPGQDRRYSVNCEKIKQLGWQPKMTMEEFLPICKKMNEERSTNWPIGKKRKILRVLKLENSHLGKKILKH
jgi:dTDP-glucose 4,6-dehydratase